MMKKTIAVLFGGCSPEHDISLQSAYSVLCAIDRTRYDVIPVGITRDGEWYRFSGGLDAVIGGTWCDDPSLLVPVEVYQNRKDPGLIEFTGRPGCGYRITHIDAAFPVLHGKNGEDGTIQGLFEMAGIPVIGCGVLASALCMDKHRAHQLASLAGVPSPKGSTVRKYDGKDAAARLAAEIGYPVFVKPVKAGSSFGITKVRNEAELSAAVELAFTYDDTVIIEESISGVEIGCAVIGDSELTVGMPDEIEMYGDFFDFTEKYTLKTSSIHVPARISPELTEKARETAKVIYRALDCSGFARVDMFLTDGGELLFNEVNTIPGFTSHSRFPTMLKAIGMSFEEVVARVIELAVGE